MQCHDVIFLIASFKALFSQSEQAFLEFLHIYLIFSNNFNNFSGRTMKQGKTLKGTEANNKSLSQDGKRNTEVK